MAGDWIKMRRSLLNDGKVVRIMSALDADRFRTIGAVFSAWCLFDEQTEDGNLPGYTPKVFDEIVGVPGICQAMANVGWIEISKNSLFAVNFEEHNGATARRRAQESVRKMSARDADKKRPREEKRREENKDISKKESAPASQYSASFILFWDVYPQGGQTGKLAASKSFAKAIKLTTLENLIAAGIRYGSSKTVKDGYVKNAATWLNQGCWDDSVTCEPKVSRVATADDLRDYNPNDPRYT